MKAHETMNDMNPSLVMDGDGCRRRACSPVPNGRVISRVPMSRVIVISRVSETKTSRATARKVAGLGWAQPVAKELRQEKIGSATRKKRAKGEAKDSVKEIHGQYEKKEQEAMAVEDKEEDTPRQEAVADQETILEDRHIVEDVTMTVKTMRRKDMEERVKEVPGESSV